MSIDYRSAAFPEHLRKPAPRVLVKKAKDTRKASDDRRNKAMVRLRDKNGCRICLFRRVTEVHELVPKSKGGVASLFNSVGLCGAANGGLCHQLIQTHAISYSFKQPGRGADGPMVFTMNRSVAEAVFGRRVVPTHCEVIEESRVGVGSKDGR